MDARVIHALQGPYFEGLAEQLQNSQSGGGSARRIRRDGPAARVRHVADEEHTKHIVTPSLTAVSWDVSGAIGFRRAATTSVTVLFGGWNTTTDTADISTNPFCVSTAGKYFQRVTARRFQPTLPKITPFQPPAFRCRPPHPCA